MNQLRNLPMAARIGAAGAAAALILALVFVFTMSGSSSVVVRETPNPDQAAAWSWRLEQAGIKSTTEQKGGTSQVMVLDSKKSDAEAVLNGTSRSVRFKGAKSTGCKAPGALDGPSAREAADLCNKQQAIRNALTRRAGILEAVVSIAKEESDSGFGKDTSKVTVLLFLMDGTKIEGSQLADQIANQVSGATRDTVVISDDRGTVIWSKGMASGETAAGGTGCVSDPAADFSVTEKQQILASCIEDDLRKQIGEMVGGEDRVQVFAGVTLSAAAKTQSIEKVLKGVVENQNKSANGTDTTYSNGKSTVNSTSDAGIIQRLSLAVQLDSRYVKPATENAVRQMLTTQQNPLRHDPPPKVGSSEFTTSAPVSDEAKQEIAGAAASGASNAGSSSANTTPLQKSSMSGSLLAFILIAVVGFITVIALLWRKSSRLAEERKRFEHEFQNDQQLFQNYAQTNPDEMARELEALLGAPAGQPATR